ncbi:hypothetical protein [Thiorhodococcus minor]|uniref:Uncharacterized protein n=1 Tax=Thiorhodococcus minor TaxID=57489 RepID=A0A6M0JXE5_9GAMM|nr:hypothetical protein [Thiorhodococcus minor]NEV60775.1 hypothetical protein [Thiorhodococcus minor]
MTTIPSHKEIQALVDRLLLEQGRLDPFELLLAADLLAYEDYEAWRTGARPDLESVLHGSPAEIAELLEQAADYARRQKLEPTPLAHGAWGGASTRLSVGPSRKLEKACAESWAPAAERMQLDLFHDSSERLLEEAIRLALAERRLDAARAQVSQLAREHPRHPDLRGYLRLIQCLDDSAVASPGMRAADRIAELEGIEPLARQLLGHRARDLLAVLWAALAERLDDRDFDPADPRLHPSHAWARAGRWEAVRASIECVEHWADWALLLERHAEAAWRRRDIAAARQDWLRLCWEYPPEAERLLRGANFPDPWLARLWRDFEDLEALLETEDFPAWLLLQESVGAPPPPPERAPADERGDPYRLLHLMVSGDDDIALRRQLDEIHPELLRQYLRRRAR